MADRPFAYVCSPYSGDVEANAEKARTYSRQVYEAGYCPLTPHLLFPQFLKDDIPAEREAGMAMGAQLLTLCRVLVVCGDEISEGMAREIALAKDMHIPLFAAEGFSRESQPIAYAWILARIAAAETDQVRKTREKNGEIGKIYVDVANPHMTNPMGHVDTMLKLPVTKEEFSEALRSIGIGSKYYPQQDYYFHSIQSWDDRLREHMPRKVDDNGFNELNYLAAKLNGLTEPQREMFAAILESGRHCGSVKDIINITENLNTFDLLPFRSDKEYGEFLGLCGGDEHSEAILRLMESDDHDDRALCEYITGLETHIDAKAYGRFRVENEGGVFTEYGYLTGGEDFEEIYTGVQDIPAEYRVAAFPESERAPRETGSVLEKIATARTERAYAPVQPEKEKPKTHGSEL